MRRLAAQIARWRQPGLPESPSKVLPSLRPQQSQPASRARIRIPPALQENGPTAKIRVFEQDNLESTERQELDPDEEDNGEMRAFEGEIRKLKQEAKDLEDPFSPNNPVMQALSKEEQAKLLGPFPKAENEEDNEASEGGAEEQSQEHDTTLEKPPRKCIDEVQLQVAPEHRKLIKMFNVHLQKNAYFQQTTKSPPLDVPLIELGRLWIWYNRCKDKVPYFRSAIPPQAWEVLWDAQGAIPFASTRAAHLRALAEDIENLGGTLNPQQSLTFIDCLDIGGEKATAIETWKAYEIDLEDPSEIVTNYLSLGLRLYSTQGDLKKALSLALRLIERNGLHDLRSVKPMIVAQSKVGGEYAAKQAWMSYLVLKEGLKENMNMEDYDEISVGFLKNGRPELALAVFKDMMLSQRTSQYDSLNLYRTFQKHIGKLQSSAIAESDLNKWSLGALVVLPREFQNKFFYGSWVKKLIGMGEIDAAAMVIDLEYAREVQPDSRHMNGMIAAWIRQNTKVSRTKAESLAWAMIRARIDFVSRRGHEFGPKGEDRSSLVDDTPRIIIPEKNTEDPLFLRRDVPRATTETFSVLIKYYARNYRDDKVLNHLLYCLRSSEINPSSYIMNHLLYRQLRLKNLESVMKIFDDMSPQVGPDLETFACFWDCSKLNYDQQKLKINISKSQGTLPKDFPTPRAIYRAMVTALDRFLPSERAKANAQFSRELYDQIILCFCLFRDLQGALVAIHSLASRFNMYPDEKTASIVVNRISRMVPIDYSKLPSMTSNYRRRLRRLKGNPEYEASLKAVAQVLETIHNRRLDAFTEEGLSLEDCDEQVQHEHRLGTLTDLVMTALWRVRAEKDDVPERLDRRFKEVAEMMGCEVKWFDEAMTRAKGLIWDGVFSGAPATGEADP